MTSRAQGNAGRRVCQSGRLCTRTAGIRNSQRTEAGGEAQRIRLATQIGSRLMGVLYVLDEPSIGLHPRDNSRLLTTLEGLRDLGNTVLVVDHELLRQDMQDFLVRRDGHRAGGIDDTLDIIGHHFLVPDRHNAV